jgi:hypothetical protein
MVLHTLKHSKYDPIKWTVTQLVEAYTRREYNIANVAWLAAAG